MLAGGRLIAAGDCHSQFFYIELAVPVSEITFRGQTRRPRPAIDRRFAVCSTPKCAIAFCTGSGEILHRSRAVVFDRSTSNQRDKRNGQQQVSHSQDRASKGSCEILNPHIIVSAVHLHPRR